MLCGRKPSRTAIEHGWQSSTKAGEGSSTALADNATAKGSHDAINVFMKGVLLQAKEALGAMQVFSPVGQTVVTTINRLSNLLQIVLIGQRIQALLLPEPTGDIRCRGGVIGK